MSFENETVCMYLLIIQNGFFRYLYGKVPKKVVIDDGIDLLSVMLQHKTLAPQYLDLLRNMLLEIGRHDLIHVINNFGGDNPQGLFYQTWNLKVISFPTSSMHVKKWTIS